MAQPFGFSTGDKFVVCKLKKAIYGLKQAPREPPTGDKFGMKVLLGVSSVLVLFSPNVTPLLIYHHRGHCIYVLIYVDDIIITDSQQF